MASNHRLWERYADAYAKLLPKVSFYADSLEKMAQATVQRHQVLDLGCGPGLISRVLAANNEQVVSIDSNETMVDFATRHNADLHNVSVRLGDAHRIPLADGSIDAVVANNMLYHVDNPLQVLDEIARVTTDDAIVSLSGPLPTYDPAILFSQMMNDLKAQGLDTTHPDEIQTIIEANQELARTGIPNPYTNKQIEDLLRERGFVNILTSTTMYKGQCFFVTAAKANVSSEDIAENPTISGNEIVTGETPVPEQFRTLRNDQYEFSIATTPEELMEAFNVRFVDYTRSDLYEEDPAVPFDFDKYDQHAAVFYARNRATGQMVATVRLIFERDGHLYIEDSYDISKLRADPDKVMAEGSRLATNPRGIKINYDGQQVPISDFILNRATEFAYHSGITHLVGLSRVRHRGFFATNGYFPQNGELEVIGIKDGKINPGEALFPVILDVKQVFEGQHTPALRMISAMNRDQRAGYMFEQNPVTAQGLATSQVAQEVSKYQV